MRRQYLKEILKMRRKKQRRSFSVRLVRSGKRMSLAEGEASEMI